MHPPYFDILKFSNNPNDLSNAKTLQDFLKLFGSVVKNYGKYYFTNGDYFIGEVEESTNDPKSGVFYYSNGDLYEG